MASLSARCCAALLQALVLLLPAKQVPAELAITNIRDAHPDDHVPLDKASGRPVRFWQGNYSDAAALSCVRSGDLLFDWSELKAAMSGWLHDVQQGDHARMMQTYWERIRPIQHSLTNIVAFHNLTTSRDCVLGMLAVRMFYLTFQSPAARTLEVIDLNNLAIDWHYYSRLFSWSVLARTGWGSVLWPSVQILSSAFQGERPSLLWVDCDRLPGGEELPESLQQVHEVASSASQLLPLERALAVAGAAEVGACPVSFAFAAILLAWAAPDADTILHYMDVAQEFIGQYREKNDWTFVNLLHFRRPFFGTLSAVALRTASELSVDKPAGCGILWCPQGGTPNPLTCACESIFPEAPKNVTACFFMVDTRRVSSLRNITSVLNARFWTLTYGINRLYAEDHGYEIEYVQPDRDAHFPDRKVGWAKVKVTIDRLRAYGPERCAYGVSIDTDAYMRSSESLAAVIHHYGLDEEKLILFSQEYHTELRPNRTFANGGFFIVRNSPAGIALLEEWYNVPEVYPDMAHLKKDNPQGLNLCWDEKMQDRRAESVVLAPSYLFTAPCGWFVRHNWFKDLRFEQEMMDVLLHRLQRKYGCIMCQNVYDWDNSMNFDVGWR